MLRAELVVVSAMGSTSCWQLCRKSSGGIGVGLSGANRLTNIQQNTRHNLPHCGCGSNARLLHILYVNHLMTSNFSAILSDLSALYVFMKKLNRLLRYHKKHEMHPSKIRRRIQADVTERSAEFRLNLVATANVKHVQAHAAAVVSRAAGRAYLATPQSHFFTPSTTSVKHSISISSVNCLLAAHSTAA